MNQRKSQLNQSDNLKNMLVDTKIAFIMILLAFCCSTDLAQKVQFLFWFMTSRNRVLNWSFWINLPGILSRAFPCFIFL